MKENAVGKGEIARHEQFLLFPQCFQQTCSRDTQKQWLFCGEGGNVKNKRPCKIFWISKISQC